MLHSDIEDLAAMVESYLYTALWTWTDSDGHAPYGDNTVHVEATEVFDLRSIVRATDDCRSFCEYVDDIAESGIVEDTAARQALADMAPIDAGGDFWLTRERHGTGFWDRGLDAAGHCLARAARTFGDAGMHIDDDGQASLS
jgi:hypothetical protein